MVPKISDPWKTGPFSSGANRYLVLPSFSTIFNYPIISNLIFFCLFLIFWIHHCTCEIAKSFGFNSHGSPWTVNFVDFRVTTFWLLLSPWLLLLLLHTLSEFLSTPWVEEWIAQPPCSPSTSNSLQFLCPLVLLRRYLSFAIVSFHELQKKQFTWISIPACVRVLGFV